MVDALVVVEHPGQHLLVGMQRDVLITGALAGCAVAGIALLLEAEDLGFDVGDTETVEAAADAGGQRGALEGLLPGVSSRPAARAFLGSLDDPQVPAGHAAPATVRRRCHALQCAPRV